MSRSDAGPSYAAVEKATRVQGWFGFYWGRVEQTSHRLGRVRVRVFAVHGQPERTPTESLPWAPVAEPGPGAADAGTFDPPVAGATVMVVFQHGHRDFPAVLGAVRGSPREQHAYMDDGSWVAPAGEETPKDVYHAEGQGAYPATRRVWNKSIRGAAIVVEDGAGKEFLRVVDRAGQVLEMRAAVTPELNANNATQRGARVATEGTQLPQEQLVDARGYVRLMDAAGQELLLDGSAGAEYVELRSQTRTGYSRAFLRLSSAKGGSTVTLQTSAGDGLLADARGAVGVALVDRRGTKVELIPETRTIRLTASKIEHVTGEVNDTHGKVTRRVNGNLTDKVLANRQINVGGDDVLTTIGSMHRVVGGALDLTVANAGLAGVALDAVRLGVLIGGITLETKLGAVTLKNLLGSVSIDEIGNVSMKVGPGPIPLAEVTISPAGTIDIRSIGQVVAASQIRLDGVNWNHAHITPFGLTSMPIPLTP